MEGSNTAGNASSGGGRRARIGRGGKFTLGNRAGKRIWRPEGDTDAREAPDTTREESLPQDREAAEDRHMRLKQLQETKAQIADEERERASREEAERDQQKQAAQEAEGTSAAQPSEPELKAEQRPLDSERTSEPPAESRSGERKTGERREAERPALGKAATEKAAGGAAEKAASPSARSQESKEESGESQPARTPRSKPRRSRTGGGARAAERSGRRGRLTVVKALTHGSEEERQRSLAAVRRRRARERRRTVSPDAERVKVVRDVQIPDAITVQELANRMAESGDKVEQKLKEMGHQATSGAELDGDTAELVVREFGHRPLRVSASDVEIGLEGPDDEPAALRPRAAVVTVMGHVDHGKTSLLDAIRGTQVASGEAGAITQHIGAYRVETPDGTVTFIDTPGHAAFSAMRAHGARITDIVVLVVAADDGLMPQTEEAIDHARAAGVPIVVAINKCDLEAADPDRVREALLRKEVVVEAHSGDVLDVEISAKTGDGLPELLKAILLQAELMELRANPDRSAVGAVIEARLDRGRGPLATVLVQRGTLRRGDNVVVGSEFGRVRALRDDRGEQVDSAGPSMPVEIDGLRRAPDAGDKLVVVESEARARSIADYRSSAERGARIAPSAQRPVDFLMQGERVQIKRLNLVIKADVRGSAEAIVEAIKSLGAEDLEVEVLHSGVGAIAISDVSLAASSDARLIGFNVRPDSQARSEAKRLGVAISHHSVIYDLLNQVRDLGSGLLDPDIVETALGAAEVREVFHIHRVGAIAGCRVQGGEIRRGAKARVMRHGAMLYSGSVDTLKHHKEEVPSVSAGMECGIQVGGFGDFAVGDLIEAFETQEVARTL